jgi:hypothetical protein
MKKFYALLDDHIKEYEQLCPMFRGRSCLAAATDRRQRSELAKTRNRLASTSSADLAARLSLPFPKNRTECFNTSMQGGINTQRNP